MLRDFRQVSVGCLDAARESGRALTSPSAKHAIHCEHIEKNQAFRRNVETSSTVTQHGSTHSRRFWRTLDTLILKRCGDRALGLIAVRIRPPNGLSRTYQGSLESLYGATFNPPFRCLAR